MVVGILRHLSPFIVRFFEKEELVGMVVDDIAGRGEKRGLADDRLGSPSVTSA